MAYQVRNARFAVVATFAMCGFNFANWASRLPVVKAELGLSGGDLAILLLFVSGGSLTAIPLAGVLTDRWGTRQVVGSMAVVMTLGLAGAVSAVALGTTIMAAISLYIMGLGMGTWDVAMNVEGAIVEHELQKSVMAQFHAAWSMGTVAGAGVGAIMAATGVPINWHLYGILIVSLSIVLYAVRHYLPPEARLEMGAEQTAEAVDASQTADAAPNTGAASGTPATATDATSGAPATSHAPTSATDATSSAPITGTAPEAPAKHRSPWLEARTLLIGLLVLAATLTEGAANDWIAVAVESEMTPDLTERASETVGAISLGVFLTAMTAMRLFGNGLLDRRGRVFVLRLSAACGVIGLLLFGLSPWFYLAVVGIALWGLGSALGFPVGMSAASDDPLRAARRVAVVAAIGYTAFLAGPPLVGFVADHLGYRNSLLLIAIPMAIGFVIAAKAAPLPGSRTALHEEALRNNARERSVKS